MTVARSFSSMLIASTLFAAPALAAPPRAEATIVRTGFGIPHITAKNFRSLGFGAAYAAAEDNICLMADTYLSASGERSRFLGAQGAAVVAVWPVKNIENDLFYAAVADDRGLRAAFARSSPDLRALIDGWVAGYNHFLAARAGTLPSACAGQPWVRPITREMVLRWINGFALFASSASFATAIANAVPPGSATSAHTGPAGQQPGAMPVSVLLGSNGWAFGADATANGRGLVVGNPHFPWAGANRFYEMHMTIPGKFDVAGASIVGQPYIGIGFNKDIAWTHTVDTAVHMTLARLTLDPADATAYMVDGERERMSRRTVKIAVKDGEAVTRTLYASRYGPIMTLPGTPYAWTGRTAYAVADANQGNVRAGENYLDFARAHRVADLRDSLFRHLGVSFINTIAADRHGNALYADVTPAPNISAAKLVDCGMMGEKLPALYGRAPILDGSRSACAWDKAPGTPVPGLLPGSAMAVLVRRDFVQNSNDSYRWTNPAAPLALGPMMGSDPRGTPDLRTRSGLQEIARVLAGGKFDVDVGAATMLGNRVFLTPHVLPVLKTLCTRPTAPADACAAIARWDGKAEVTSHAAMLFAAFWSKASARSAELWATPFDPADPVGTPAVLKSDGADGDALLADLAAGAATSKALGIALDAPLGDIQYAERGSERIPISGLAQGGVLNFMAGLPRPGGFSVFHGSSYVQSVTFDDNGPVAKAVLSYSQSTDPSSPHYADQTRAFSVKELRKFPFTAAEVAADAIGAPMTVRQ